MPFNSYFFIFLFLPVTLLGYYLIGKSERSRIAIIWLVATSLLFYGWYNPIYVVLILCSILFNYLVGTFLARRRAEKWQKSILTFGIIINILLLAYFKYANFFIDNTNAIFNSDFHLNTIILPLGISFFTLQQISYLVDTYRGETIKHSFINYCLLVTFFPKLISGPIVRFKEMMPQIAKKHVPIITQENMAIGLTILLLGLFKKVILADHIGGYADQVFDAVNNGYTISFVDAWISALAYTFQIYFDFSGYCDMAIGIALMFGIRLPLNFYSPYKATGIIDFWRRWHMTLSRFIRDYLYIPLGGNRRGFTRQMFNLLVVMVIIGFWHGAGWTFIVWGALHGLYLVINHSWRRMKRKSERDSKSSTVWGTAISTLITFIAVTIAWVFFRADTLVTATKILKGMIGMNGVILPISLYDKLGVLGPLLNKIGISFSGLLTNSFISALFLIITSIIICWFLPNVQEYMSNYNPALDSFVEEKKKYSGWIKWAPSLWTSALVAGMGALAILGLTHVSEFIYFQF